MAENPTGFSSVPPPEFVGGPQRFGTANPDARSLAETLSSPSHRLHLRGDHSARRQPLRGLRDADGLQLHHQTHDPLRRRYRLRSRNEGALLPRGYVGVDRLPLGSALSETPAAGTLRPDHG